MNKKIFSLILALTFLTTGAGALAQSNDAAATSGVELPAVSPAELLAVSAVELPSAGIAPDSPFYFLKTWKESIQTFFTFGAENKAKQFLHLADVRLAEYLKMMEKGKTEIAEKTLEKYASQLDRALEKSDEQGAISEKVLKHREVLKNVLEKAPEAARPGIEKAIKASKEAEIKIGQKIEEGLKEAPSEVQNCIRSIISKAGEIKGGGDIQAILMGCMAPGTKIPPVVGGVIDAEFLKKIQEFYGKSLPAKDAESLNKLIEAYKDKTLQEIEIPSGKEMFDFEEIKQLQENLQKDLDEQYKNMAPEELEYLKKMQEQGQLESQTPIEIQGGGSGMGL